jgi:succinate dehydrogenase/fumarate reductase iron-sulfur protein
MQVDLRILRYDPERDTKPHWESYTVESDPKADRVLDLLHRVKYEQDGTLTFRRSCAHGVCGSDAMLVNGRNWLACQADGERSARRAWSRLLVAITTLQVPWSDGSVSRVTDGWCCV